MTRESLPFILQISSYLTLDDQGQSIQLYIYRQLYRIARKYKSLQEMFLIALIFLGNSPKLLGNEMSPLALSKKFKAPLAFGTSLLYQFQEIKFSGMAGISEII